MKDFYLLTYCFFVFHLFHLYVLMIIHCFDFNSVELFEFIFDSELVRMEENNLQKGDITCVRQFMYRESFRGLISWICASDPLSTAWQLTSVVTFPAQSFTPTYFPQLLQKCRSKFVAINNNYRFSLVGLYFLNRNIHLNRSNINCLRW
jgi:hypothetical protein